MAPGACMVVVIETGRHELAELLPQTFTADTQMLPPTDPAVTVMLFEPCPDVMVHPVGTLHVYDTAPFTGSTAYTSPVIPEHTLAFPEMVPGIATVLLMFIDRQEATDVVPQEFVAVTHIEPPAEPEVTLIAVVP